MVVVRLGVILGCTRRLSFIRGELKLVVLGMRQKVELAKSIRSECSVRVKLFLYSHIQGCCFVSARLLPRSKSERSRKSSVALHKIINLQMNASNETNCKSFWLYKATESVREENEVRVGGVVVARNVRRVTGKIGRIVRNKDTGRSYGRESIEIG